MKTKKIMAKGVLEYIRIVSVENGWLVIMKHSFLDSPLKYVFKNWGEVINYLSEIEITVEEDSP